MLRVERSSNQRPLMTTEPSMPVPISPEPLLSLKQLIAALEPYLPRRPCARTLRRWDRSGMPYIPVPESPQRWYRLSAVLAWIVGHEVRRNVKRDAEDRAVFYVRGPRRVG